jgi:subfamily B ATP-binding cassette protein MsbA
LKFRLPFRRLDPRLSRELAAQRRPISLGLACVVVAAILEGLTIPLIDRSVTAIQQAAPRAGGPGNMEAVQRLMLFAGLVVAVFGLKYFFTRGQTFYLGQATARLTTDLRTRLVAKLQRLPVGYFGTRRIGNLQSVLTNDVNVFQSAVGLVRDSLDGPLKAGIAFLYIVFNQWQLAVVTLAFLPVMAFVIQRNGKRMRAAQAAVQADLGHLNAMAQETISGVRVIKAFGAENTVQAAYDRLADQTYRSQLGALRQVASLRPAVEFLGATALAAVLVVCGYLSYYGMLQLGQIAALLYALDRINQGFKSIGNVTNTYNQVQAAADRIWGEILDQPDPPAARSGGRTLPTAMGRLEFHNVSFAYPDGTPALHQLSFVLEPGCSLALVGPSGAGKTTVADLVLRFYDPTEGRILFDGVDVRELDVAWLRAQIGVVPQHTLLFAGTLEENLRLGAPEATPEALAEACRVAHVQEFAPAEAGGLAMRVGEGGSGLSGGQRQRVAIARAIVRNPKLLLLDEATSALDAAGERAVTEALGEVMRHRTTLFIAHRLTTAARADRILVMRRGEAVEMGTHAELLGKGGVYAGLFRAFSGGVLD